LNARRRLASGRGAAAVATRLVIASVLAVALLTFGLGAATLPGGAPVIAAGPQIVLAASPEPSAPGGDTRSPGEGPGLVGAPFLAVGGIVALGLLAAGATLLYLRLTTGSGEARRTPGKGRSDRPD
jgi:hypothetical protein